MLSRLLFLLPAFLFYTFQTRAQAYEPGLLVTSTGDTLRGEIENGLWTEPPAFIRFRPAAGSPSQLFQPRQLRAVSFTGGRYFRYEALPIDHGASTRLDAVQNSRAEVKIDSLLAEVLLDGPVMLWKVVRPNSTHFLLRRPNQPILDLCERRYVRQSPSGMRQIVDGNNYRGQLKIYFGDCPAAVAAAESAAFTPLGMAEVAQAYHQHCLPNKPVVRNWLTQATPRRRMSLQGGVVAGVRYNYFKNQYDRLPETQACTDCQIRPFAGLYADLFQPSRTTAIYGELSVSTFSSQNWAYFQSNSLVSYYVVNYRAWLASARLGLRFFFPLPQERQWLFSVGYELNKTLRPTITSTSGDLTVSDDQLYYAPPTLLPNVGLGWRTKRITLSLDGQMYTSADAEGILGLLLGSNFAARAGLAYRLGRNPDVTKAR